MKLQIRKWSFTGFGKLHAPNLHRALRDVLLERMERAIRHTWTRNKSKEGFLHDDIDELFVDDALSDNDIIDLTLDLTVDGVVGLEEDNDEEEKSTTLTGKLIQEGLQLCSKIIFLIN
ncbi:hypothetical protein TNCV_4012271 [Trichonephila clavipes]|nr:hypothetical protein TNCV_4012271 [Trichonephila clavipes]